MKSKPTCFNLIPFSSKYMLSVGMLFILIFSSAILSGCKKNSPSNKGENTTVPGTTMEAEVSPETGKDTESIITTEGGEASGNKVSEPDIGDEADVGQEGAISGVCTFSLTETFYSANTQLEITGSKPGKIYYTLDGTDPDKEQKLYEGAIQLTAGKDISVVPVKAKAFFDDGTQSETLAKTFFIGEGVDSRYDTLIFSVTTDPYNLYDDEYGILIEGKLRREYKKENPGKKIDPPAPANYNMRGRESEREVFLEVFEADGTTIAAHKAGIRVYGGWSRANIQKSIKIFTRKSYDTENNKLRYEFFPEKLNYKGSPADAFNRLVIRNCGNDNGFTFIRDELFQTLAGQAGYMDYQAVRPVVMYINGDYRGTFWLHEVYGEEYFDEYYGKYDGEFQILEGGETFKKLDDDGENEQAVTDYEEFYNTYAYSDLTDDAVYEELNKLMDVENYLSYYALQIYIGNEDWPHNNYKTYRYYAAEGEEYREAPFDGKWRYLLHDLDYSFGIYGNGALMDNIWKYIGANGEIKNECPLFGQLMKREDCKEIFITKTMDLINGAFAPDNISKVLEKMHLSRLNEQLNMYDKRLLADWVRFDQLEGRMEELKNYGELRAGHIPNKYQTYFKLGDLYSLSVKPAEGCGVRINSFETEASFSGRYFTDYATVITPIIPEGKQFDHWKVNGKTYKDSKLVITKNLLTDLKAEVIAVVK